MNLRVPRSVPAALAAIALLCIPALTLAGQGRSGVRMPGLRQARPRAPRERPTPKAPAPSRPAPGAAAPAPTPGPESKPLEVFQSAGGTKMIRMEFYGLEIDYLLRLLSREAGVTIIKSEQVTGPVTIIAPDPVPLDVAFQILNSVLQVRGFTMVRGATGVYKVIPIADAIQSGPPIEFGASPEDVPSTDVFITQVIPFSNLDAGDVAAQIQGLLSQNASIIPTSINSLIITDTAANIQRALTIVADTEAQLSGGLQVIPLRYYDAEGMCDLVNSLVLGRGGAVGAPGAGRRVLPYERRVTPRAGAPAQAARPAGAAIAAVGGMGPEFCYPDVRTNSMIVLAIPKHFEQIQELVEQLDRPITLRDSFYVYPVQNLIASELAQKIAPLIGAQVVAAPAGGAAPRPAGAPAPGGPSARARAAPGYGAGAPGAGRVRPQSAAPAASERPVRGAGIEVEPLAGTASDRSAPDPIVVAQAGEAPTPAVPVQPQPAAPPIDITAPPPEVAPSAGPSIQQSIINADDNTNTLLVSAAPEQLDLVRQLLEQLDVAPPQVHIQAIIAEVILARKTSLGFQWENLGRTFGTFQGGTFTGDFSSNFGLGQLQKDASGNVTGPTGFFGQIKGPQFHAILAALTTDSHARILSTPSIFTSNNQEAQIDVSSSRPFPRGSLTTTVGTGAAISTSVDYQSVGIVLTVTPRVTQGDIVQMEVTVSADEPGASVSIAGQDYPSVNRRQTRAALSVKDGNTIIIGGLMRDTITRSGSRVPILGDLPIIGSLFRSTSSNRDKSELLVFLTPRIVRSPAEATAIADKIKEKMIETPRSLQTPSDEHMSPASEKR